MVVASHMDYTSLINAIAADGSATTSTATTGMDIAGMRSGVRAENDEGQPGSAPNSVANDIVSTEFAASATAVHQNVPATADLQQQPQGTIATISTGTASNPTPLVVLDERQFAVTAATAATAAAPANPINNLRSFLESSIAKNGGVYFSPDSSTRKRVKTANLATVASSNVAMVANNISNGGKNDSNMSNVAGASSYNTFGHTHPSSNPSASTPADRSKRSNRSFVWDYYTKKDGSASCNSCPKSFKITNNTGTMNLISHLNTAHHITHHSHRQKSGSAARTTDTGIRIAECVAAISRKSPIFSPTPSTSIPNTDFSTLPSTPALATLANLPATSESSLSLSETRRERVKQTSIELLARELLPMHMIKDTQSIFALLEPRAPLPTSLQVHQVLQESRASSMRHIGQLLQGTMSVSLTLDVWLDEHELPNLTTVFVFLDQKFAMFRYEFVTVLTYGYDGQELADILEEILANEYFDVRYRVAAIVSNQDERLVRAVELLNAKIRAKKPDKTIWHRPCYLYTVGQIVQAGMQSIEWDLFATPLLKKHRSLVLHFQQYPQHVALMKTANGDEQLMSQVPCLDTPGQWWTMFQMMQANHALMTAYQALENYLKRVEPDKAQSFQRMLPTSDDWKATWHIIQLLEPFHNASIILSSPQTSDLSTALLVVHGLRLHLQKPTSVPTDIEAVYRAMSADLSKCWPITTAADTDSRMYELRSALLAPQTKLCNLSRTELERKQLLGDFGQDLVSVGGATLAANSDNNGKDRDVIATFLTYGSGSNSRAAGTSDQSTISTAATIARKRSASGMSLDSTVSPELSPILPLTPAATAAALSSMVLSEADRYMEDLQDPSMFAQMWWAKHWQKYPHVGQLARYYLCTPAATADAQRAYHKAGSSPQGSLTARSSFSNGSLSSSSPSTTSTSHERTPAGGSALAYTKSKLSGPEGMMGVIPGLYPINERRKVLDAMTMESESLAMSCLRAGSFRVW